MVPFQLFLTNGTARCGAVLVHPRYALTAAHCAEVLKDDPNTFVWGGVSDLGKLDPIKFQRRDVAKWSIHPEYNLTTLQNDIAVMEFYHFIDTKAIPIKPIKINVFDFASDFPDQRPYMISGFGAIGYNKNGLPVLTNYLSVANTTIVNREYCRKYWERHVEITDKHVCTSVIHSGTLGGDSGGPLFHEHHDTVNNVVEWRLLGITSFGSQKLSIFAPDVYARASLYCPWITEVTGTNVECSFT
uniref:Peptidase S1 domain-containing protein n=1 Tax=Steinernema glaseri TaxID=37863 RepID=A0A1I8AU74_9BILA